MARKITSGFDPKELNKLDKALKSATRKIQDKIIRTSVKAASVVVTAALKSLTPQDTGKLKQSINFKIKKSTKRGKFLSKIGATGNHAFKSRFLERGTAAHLISQPKMNRQLRHPGSRPSGFMSKAFNRSLRLAIAVASKKLKDGITKFI